MVGYGGEVQRRVRSVRGVYVRGRTLRFKGGGGWGRGGRGGLGWWSDGGDGQAEKRRLSYISLRLCPWNIAINIQFIAQAHALAQALAQT